MNMRGIAIAIPKNMLFLSLGLFLLALAGCGSTTNAATSPNATSTACVQATRPATSLRNTTGTLKSINGSTFSLTNQQGKDVSVSYSSTTIFTQQSAIAASDLQEGTRVIVLVTQNGNSYDATSIMAVTTTTNGNGFNGFPRGNGTPGAGRGGNNPCFTGRRGQSGTATPNGFRGLNGTVGQLNGNTLSITEASGSSFSVTITPQTKIITTKTVTADALKVGQPLTVSGTVDSQGTISARTVSILLSLPTPRATATPSS